MGAKPMKGDCLQVVFALKRPEEVEFSALTVDQWADLGDDEDIIYVVHFDGIDAGNEAALPKKARP